MHYVLFCIMIIIKSKLNLTLIYKSIQSSSVCLHPTKSAILIRFFPFFFSAILLKSKLLTYPLQSSSEVSLLIDCRLLRVMSSFFKQKSQICKDKGSPQEETVLAYKRDQLFKIVTKFHKQFMN